MSQLLGICTSPDLRDEELMKSDATSLVGPVALPGYSIHACQRANLFRCSTMCLGYHRIVAQKDGALNIPNLQEQSSAIG
jgi:hypothetical protein